MEKGDVAIDISYLGDTKEVILCAENSTLSIMVGVDREAFKEFMDIFVSVGTNIIYESEAGSWQMNNMAPRILKGDFDPGFFIKHYIRDMKIADDEAKNVNLELDILEGVLKMYEKLQDKGMGDLGTQALIKYYENK